MADHLYGDTLKHLACCGRCGKLLTVCACTAAELDPLQGRSDIEEPELMTDEEAFARLRERAKGDSEAEAAVEAFIHEVERIEIVGHIEVIEYLCKSCGYHQTECICGLPSFRAIDPSESFEAFDRKREDYFANRPAHERWT